MDGLAAGVTVTVKSAVAAKFAVTLAGAFSVRLCEAVAPVRDPVKPVKV
jgi:hypothetical protein